MARVEHNDSPRDASLQRSFANPAVRFDWFELHPQSGPMPLEADLSSCGSRSLQFFSAIIPPNRGLARSMQSDLRFWDAKPCGSRGARQQVAVARQAAACQVIAQNLDKR